MMTVRAKFKVDRIDQNNPGSPDETFAIMMSPVYKGDTPDSENSKFFRATPAGQIQMFVVSPEAATSFVVGQEYYVDFTPAEGGDDSKRQGVATGETAPAPAPAPVTEAEDAAKAGGDTEGQTIAKAAKGKTGA